jgi:hypothetical protein
VCFGKLALCLHCPLSSLLSLSLSLSLCLSERGRGHHLGSRLDRGAGRWLSPNWSRWEGSGPTHCPPPMQDAEIYPAHLSRGKDIQRFTYSQRPRSLLCCQGSNSSQKHLSYKAGFESFCILPAKLESWHIFPIPVRQPPGSGAAQSRWDRMTSPVLMADRDKVLLRAPSALMALITST